MISVLLRFLYMAVGWLLLLPLVLYSKHKGAERLPSWAFSWDNEEDGYDGDKRKWYSKHLKRPVTAWDAYVWCAWRNPCWNLRFHKWVSIGVDIPEVTLEYKGTVKNHLYKPGKQWYDTVINGKYKSHFRLIPITETKSLYIRWGWKIYPYYYFSSTKELPLYKKRSVWAFTIRIRS